MDLLSGTLTPAVHRILARAAAAALLLAACAGLLRAQDIDDEPPGDAIIDSSISEAWRFVSEGRYEDARDLADLIIREDSTLFGAWMTRGVANYRLRNDNEALYDLRTAARLDSTSALPHAWIGDVELSRGSLQDAQDAAARALERDSGMTYACYILAIVDFRNGRKTEALRAMRILCMREPDAVLYQAVRGNMALQADSRDAAVDAYARAVALAPSGAELHAGYARALLRTWNWDSAAAEAGRALALGADSLAVLPLSIVAAREGGRRAQAGSLMRELERLFERDERARLSVAWTLFDAGLFGQVFEMTASVIVGEDTDKWECLTAYRIAAMAAAAIGDAGCVCRSWAAVAGADSSAAATIDRDLPDWPPLSGLCADSSGRYAFARGVIGARTGATWAFERAGLRFPPSAAGLERIAIAVDPDPANGVRIEYRGNTGGGLTWARVTVAPASAAEGASVADAAWRTATDTRRAAARGTPPALSARLDSLHARVARGWRDPRLVRERRLVVWNDVQDSPVATETLYDSGGDETRSFRSLEYLLFSVRGYAVTVEFVMSDKRAGADRLASGFVRELYGGDAEDGRHASAR